MDKNVEPKIWCFLHRDSKYGEGIKEVLGTQNLCSNSNRLGY